MCVFYEPLHIEIHKSHQRQPVSTQHFAQHFAWTAAQSRLTHFVSYNFIHSICTLFKIYSFYAYSVKCLLCFHHHWYRFHCNGMLHDSHVTTLSIHKSFGLMMASL